MKPIRLGTRGSALALAQTNLVIGALATQGVASQAVTFSTRGDRDLSKPLHELGDKGLFTQELEAALKNREIDAAVHSAKDMSAFDDPALPIVAALERETKADVLIGARLGDLMTGAKIGTSSLRRRAQLKALRPDLQAVPIRGNLNTRLKKLSAGAVDALILAEAGLKRLDLLAGLTLERLPFLPAPAQGIIAIQALALSPVWTAINHQQTWNDLHVERAMVRGLGGHCRLPMAIELHGQKARIEAWHCEGNFIYRQGLVRNSTEAQTLGSVLREALPVGYFDV